ncbi:MAG: hypothetical protein RMJ59_05775 [Candidatus Nitrosocaldus sp.]|nr:hypothetical protein [Candidatus Nitrosocaldus sp.]MDW8275872.1 hypothetical protein [Candidatus Nitrosocaldus sp.]
MDDIRERIEFLCDITEEDKNNITILVGIADETVFNHLNIRCRGFNIVICEGEWAMTVQSISHRSRYGGEVMEFSDTNGASFTDTRLKEIIIRRDKANFGNYLHEMVFAAMHEGLPRRLREALAWYFTLEMLKPYRYAKPTYPNWVIDLYLQPIRYLVSVFGVDFAKDLALGSIDVDDSLLPKDVQRLFLPE